MQPLSSHVSDEPSSLSPSPQSHQANNPNFNGRHVHFNQKNEESDSQESESQFFPPIVKTVGARNTPSPLRKKRTLLQTQDSKLLPHFRKTEHLVARPEPSNATFHEEPEIKLKLDAKKDAEPSTYSIAGLVQLSPIEFKKFQDSYLSARLRQEDDESSSSEEEPLAPRPKLPLSIQLSEDTFSQFYSQLSALSQKNNLEQVIAQVQGDPDAYHTAMNHLKVLKQQRLLKDLRAHLFQFIANQLKKEPPPENKQALIAMAIIAVERLESDQIFVCQPLLKQLGIHSFELFVLFHKKIENFTERELLNVILTHPDKQKVVLSTLEWVTSPRRLIGEWCETYPSIHGNQASEEKLNALRFFSSFLQVFPEALTIKDYMCIRKVINEDLLTNPTCAYEDASQEVLDKIMPYIRTLSQKEKQLLPNRHDLLSPSLSTQSPSMLMYALQSQLSQRMKQTTFDTCVKEFALDLQAYYANLIVPIPHAEFVNHNWTNPDNSPHFQAFMGRTNAFTALVSAHILKPKSEAERALQCQFYLHTAYQSIQLGNFAGAYAILGAFNKPSIQYLHLTWESVSQESKKIKEKLEKWINPLANFAVYRRKIEQASLKNDSTSGFIPILEVFIKDLFMIDEGNPNFLANGHLNFDKLKLFDSVYQYLHTHQEKLSSQSLITRTPQFKLEDSILATIKRMEEVMLAASTASSTKQSALDAYDDYLYSRFKQRESKHETR